MNIVSCIFTITITFLFPLGTVIWLSAQKKGHLKPILLGAFTFFAFQILLRLPLIQIVLPQMPWFIVMNTTQPLISALFLGVTASLFEEGGRYLIMSKFMKNRLLISDGIAFGIGHGGIEAILITGINAVFILIIDDVTVSAGLMFAGGIERLSAMICHIAWSVMVMKSVLERKIRWLFYAFGLHMLLDTVVAIVSYMGISILVIETALGIFALFMLNYIFYEYKKTRR